MTKNIFITGGTSGIGKSLIHKFAKNNYNIFFTYFNNLSEAKSISKDLQKLNIRHNYVKMDLTRIGSINNAFEKFSKQFKKLNIFINNASPAIERKKFLMLKNTDILKKMKGLLIGNIASLKNALELVLKNNSQTQAIIINISSYFTKDRSVSEYDVLEPPLGLIALLSYLNRELEEKIEGKIIKSKIIESLVF